MPPTRQQHIEQYRDNLVVAQLLEGQQHFDWCITLLFYSVLHLADVWLTRGPVARAANHAARNHQIQADQELRKDWNGYRALQNAGRDARYECAAFTAADILRIRRGEFARLRAHLSALLNIML
jgi:hypothetical protein